MARPSEEMKTEKLTYRRFKEGEHEWDAMTHLIMQASWTHKCPTYVHRTPPCQGSCPSGEDIRGWLDIVRGIEKPPKDITWQEYAFRRSTDANPFPSVMGRVCPAPCEDGCNRNEVEDHVGINAVEQFIGDTAQKNGFDFKFRMPEQETGRKIAIIGGGPAGLAAAYQLRRRGHGATVFDDHLELGGFMRYGIPGYRTPRDVLDTEIKRIVDMGVEVRTKTRIGRDVTVEQLEKDFDAILWCIGTHSGRGLPVAGWEGTPNCVSGIAFLSAFNQKRLQLVTGKVVVVGGGDTSIDVASVARRLGHIKTINEKDLPENVVWGHTAHDVASTAVREGAQVTLTSLFPVEKMTAAEREVQDALREGVTIMGNVMPIGIVKDANGRAVALKMAQCEMVKNVPQAKPGTEFEIEAELIVSAIGQKGEMTGLEAMDNGKGFIDSDAHFQVKGKKGHFVAGDIVRPHLLTTAIGQASIAVESIDHYLKAEDLTKRPKVDKHHFDLLSKLRETGLQPQEYNHEQICGTADANFAVHNYEDRAAHEVIPAERLFLGHFPYTARIKRDEIHIHADEVIGDFRERIVALTDQQAVAEAKRCMSCGMCFECDNCVIFCPQEAVKRTPKNLSTMGRYVYTDYSRCIGCHICADVCPTGYIDMGMGE